MNPVKGLFEPPKGAVSHRSRALVVDCLPHFGPIIPGLGMAAVFPIAFKLPTI